MKHLVASAASGLSLLFADLLVIIMLLCCYVLIGDLEAAGLKRPALLAAGAWLAGSAARYLRNVSQELTAPHSARPEAARTSDETGRSSVASQSR